MPYIKLNRCVNMGTIKSTTYSIHIGNNSLHSLHTFLKKNTYSSYYIICDENTFKYCLPTLLFHSPILNNAEIIELESGEDKKTLETCVQIWGALTDTDADKKSLIINLGGGVISDLGGFVASVFKRGIDFINIPTTLLSMVDASVGAKTGIDFEGIKNHIGSIYEPKGVFINPEFLETLPTEHIKSGYAEVIKIALIADKTLWRELLKLNHTKEFYSENIIAKAIELKNHIVKKDLYEFTIRKSLNFGHTIGHALESYFLQLNKPILHGYAVAFGLVIESKIAYEYKLITKKEYESICKYIESIYTKIILTKTAKKIVIDFLKHDKKNIHHKIGFALPKGIGYFESINTMDIEEIKSVL